jgi:C-terminal processing protease CtpA/Prc
MGTTSSLTIRHHDAHHQEEDRPLIPGGIYVRFSGQGVWHADGRQLQRVGLQPDVEVRRTLAGIRTGKDEVLDKALGYLQNSPQK